MNPIGEQHGPHCQVVNTGPLEAWKTHSVEMASLGGRQVPGKFFLHPVLGLTGMEVSINHLPPGAKVPFLHTHQQHEELYLFLRGRGQIQIDGEVIEVREGTAVRVSPAGERCWRNNSQEDLYYLVIQATQSSLGATGIDDGVVLPRKVSWPD